MAKRPTRDDDTTNSTTPNDEDMIPRAPREIAAARTGYRTANALNFPPEMLAKYRNAGWDLRWALCVDYKTRQFTNARINELMQRGAEIVSPNEIKKLDPNFLIGLTNYDFREDFADDDDRARGSMQAVRKDDLILMRIPLAHLEQQAAMNKRLVGEQLASSQRQAREDGLDILVNKHGSSHVKVQDGFFGK